MNRMALLVHSEADVNSLVHASVWGTLEGSEIAQISAHF